MCVFCRSPFSPASMACLIQILCKGQLAYTWCNLIKLKCCMCCWLFFVSSVVHAISAPMLCSNTRTYEWIRIKHFCECSTLIELSKLIKLFPGTVANSTNSHLFNFKSTQLAFASFLYCTPKSNALNSMSDCILSQWWEKKEARNSCSDFFHVNVLLAFHFW